MTEENTIQISAEVHAANKAAQAEFLEERVLVASQRYMDAAAQLKRVNIENGELRATIIRMSQPRPQDDENNALAELLRNFLVDDVFTTAAVESLVGHARRVLAAGEAIKDGALEGEAS